GDFDNLPGRGKPVALDPRESAADAIVAGLLKEANVVPEWIEHARAIEEGQAAIALAIADAAERSATLHQAAAALLQRRRRAAADPPHRIPFAWVRPAADDARSLETVLRRRLQESDEQRALAFAACLRRAADVRRRTHRFNDLVPLANRQQTPVSLD